VGSGVTSHRQPRQCRGAQGPKTVKGSKSDPNYVSRLLLDCVPVFHKIIISAYLLYRSGPVDKCMCQCGDNVKVSLLVWRTRYTDTFCNAVDCRFELASEVRRWTRARSECLPGEGVKIIVTPLSARAFVVLGFVFFRTKPRDWLGGERLQNVCLLRSCLLAIERRSQRSAICSGVSRFG